ncbi:ring-14 protein [Rutstroemia sp. NJR-2017a WRK4]|nr:ring-14 protein [Rutstroemia sp. NJR-2017a WRK4]
MKFAHEFKDALAREGFPQHWVESAIPYSELKKCLKRIAAELRDCGLGPDALAKLKEISNVGPAYMYEFNVLFYQESRFRPKLILWLEDGTAVDARLSPDTRNYLKELVAKHHGEPEILPAEILQDVKNSQWKSDEERSSASYELEQRPLVRRVEVPLSFDAEFFGLIQGDVTNLDALQAEEQKALCSEIHNLSEELVALTKPSKRDKKTDISRWRQLFEIYLEANIFFSAREQDRGKRNSANALRQLQWFQSEVTKRGTVKSFKLPESHAALNRFISINVTLLRNLSFQEINQTAINKILKKFDKRTTLGAREKFPKLIQSEPIMTETMAKAVCTQIAQDIIKPVPLLADFLCPVCVSICWRPVRLRCKHVVCIRCTIALQRLRQAACPLCREHVVMEADTDNIDPVLSALLKRYFPAETAEKQIELEIQDGVERFGVHYTHNKHSRCTIM